LQSQNSLPPINSFSRSVSLPMYDIAEVHASTMEILEALAASFCAIGLDAHADIPVASGHADLLRYWSSDGMLLSQSCGLPFIEDLHDVVDIVGTPLWTDISDERGQYRTVIVARESLGITSIDNAQGLRPVINHSRSLSGWCSLGVALANGAGGVLEDRSFVAASAHPYVESGGHAASLQMLLDEKADIASIDAATFRLLSSNRPALTKNLRVIGYGPLVPATPFIVSKSCGATTDEVFQVVDEVFRRPALQGAIDHIGISGFVRLANSDYDGVMELVKTAEVVLPRR
jgi:ABC-type phosphate/phosphonate transport system substrate-binding protein